MYGEEKDRVTPRYLQDLYRGMWMLLRVMVFLDNSQNYRRLCWLQ